MTLHIPALIMLILLVLLPDLYLSYQLKLRRPHHWASHLLLWLPSMLSLLGFILLSTCAHKISSPIVLQQTAWFFTLFALIYVPKLVFVTFHLLNSIVHHLTRCTSNIITLIGATCNVALFIILLTGTIHTRKNIVVKHVEIKHTDLPIQFDGLRIAHITDQHLGNWGKDTTFLSKVVNTINQQHPDIICTTGDMVNNFADEISPFIHIWQRMQAPLGKYAILGNHDYGDYTTWETPQARTANLNATKQHIRNSGFKLLLNQHTALTRGTDTLYIAGIENWGKPPFPQYGDLNKTMQNIPQNAFTILLSHDASHWKREVVERKNIQLTLSGHTHAAQMGIVTKKIKFSPSAYIYDEWDGLYQHENQFLYVNHGLGFIGMAMRIGVPPEITIITLRRDNT